jgi:hypothetical protein
MREALPLTGVKATGVDLWLVEAKPAFAYGKASLLGEWIHPL